MYPQVPDSQHVAVLLAVDKHGSMSAAARHLGIPQQTVSARVAWCEKAMGVTIFERIPAGVRATAAGRSVLAAAAAFDQAAHTFSRAVARARGEEFDRPFPVAVSHTVAELYFPQWAARLHALLPRLSIRMRQRNSAEVRRLVLDGEVPIGIVEGGGAAHGLREEEVGSDELIVVVPPGHPWADGGASLEELQTTPLIVREPGSGSRMVIEDVLGPLAEPAGEFGSLGAQRAAISSLSAPGIIAAGAVRDQVVLGRLVEVATPARFTRTIRLVTRRGAHLDEGVEALRGIVRENPPHTLV